MKKYEDKIWTVIIILTMTLCLLISSVLVGNSQIKSDTLISSKFKEHNEFLIEQQKNLLYDMENTEKSPSVYFDKKIFDRKNKKLYIYSSYDLYWSEEVGAGLNIFINRKKRKAKI